jgi:hypothetical protein
MAANVGGIDKILRIVAGAGLIGATAAGLGLHRHRAAGNGSDGLVPGLHAARHQDLPDAEVIRLQAHKKTRLGGFFHGPEHFNFGLFFRLTAGF